MVTARLFAGSSQILCFKLVKIVFPDFCYDLWISHVIGRFHTHYSSLVVGKLQAFFKFALRFSGTKQKGQFGFECWRYSRIILLLD